MAVKIAVEVPVYESNGKKEMGLNGPKLIVCSHSIYNDRVILADEDGEEAITVIGADLIAAVQNAMRTQ